jgi:phosphopantothenoylcysteine decarboxylase / phosphopantothenate---cysteine ligase
MNDAMWAHRQTRDNVTHLREALGYGILEPEEGLLAAGEGSGPGRMPEPETILAHVGRLLEGRDSALRGRRVLVTAGPTREAIDPVRFISNRSSGKMGVAIAAAAWRRGAEVTLIAGPISLAAPVGVRTRNVETTKEMADAVEQELPGAEALIMAAAPADFRPEEPATSKIKKKSAPKAVALTPTPDILASTRKARANKAVIVGFALETDDVVRGGREKLESKALDLIVVNDAREPGAGFEVNTNRVTLIGRNGTEEVLPLLAKDAVADQILDRVEKLLRDRS